MLGGRNTLTKTENEKGGRGRNRRYVKKVKENLANIRYHTPFETSHTTTVFKS